MRARAEAAIKAMPGVESASVTLTAEIGARGRRRGGPPRAGHAHAHGGGARSTSPLPGVGKSSPSPPARAASASRRSPAILPSASPKLGLKVGLLDADLYGPSAPKLFGIADRPEIGEDGHKLDPLDSSGVKVMSIGFLVEEGAPIIWRGPMVMSALTQLLREVAWAPLDVLVVDMPPGHRRHAIDMAQSVPLAGAVIVSTPQDLALIDARRGIAMFNQVHVPLLGIVENMSYFLCPHCGGRTDIFSHAGARKEAEQLGVPFLGEIPLDATIRENSDGGRPIVASLPDSAQAEAFMHIARGVAQSLSTGAARRSPRRASASPDHEEQR